MAYPSPALEPRRFAGGKGRPDERREGGARELAPGLQRLRSGKRPTQFDQYSRSTYSVPGTGPAAKGHRDEQDRAVIPCSLPRPEQQVTLGGFGCVHATRARPRDYMSHVHTGPDLAGRIPAFQSRAGEPSKRGQTHTGSGLGAPRCPDRSRTVVPAPVASPSPSAPVHLQPRCALKSPFFLDRRTSVTALPPPSCHLNREGSLQRAVPSGPRGAHQVRGCRAKDRGATEQNVALMSSPELPSRGQQRPHPPPQRKHEPIAQVLAPEPSA